jgi:biotin carboxyl carrier protein
MQPHDPEHPTREPLSEDPAHGEYPDKVSREEHNAVATSFAPETGRRTKRGVVIAVAVLAVGLLVVTVVRYFHAHAVANAGEAAYSRPPPVDVVIARPATVGQDLVLPGETAAWYETTIYARVNGYVANWKVDIGDQVKKGQVLATIETPELDAELAAAKAQLQASQAQVGARKAEADSAKQLMSAGAIRPKGWCPSRNGSQKRRITKVPRHAYMPPMRKCLWTSRKSINTTP